MEASLGLLCAAVHGLLALLSHVPSAIHLREWLQGVWQLFPRGTAPPTESIVVA